MKNLSVYEQRRIDSLRTIAGDTGRLRQRVNVMIMRTRNERIRHRMEMIYNGLHATEALTTLLAEDLTPPRPLRA